MTDAPRRVPLTGGAGMHVRDGKKVWIDHRYTRTYSIAARIDAVANEPFGYLRDLERLTCDDAFLDFLAPWQYDTVIHKFARWVADEMFCDDTEGPYVYEYVHDDGPIRQNRYLPVDLLLVRYGLSSTPPFEVPPPDGSYERTEHKMRVWRESTTVADACYDYFVNGLLPSAEYEKLLDIIADEVFQVLFQNRVLMFKLNQYIAGHVQSIDPEMHADSPIIRRYVVKRGHRLRRLTPPVWARRAVLFRDQGRCVHCRADLSGLISTLSVPNFDHMVPLAQGGLNDVTNLQLLCQGCNQSKSDSLIGTNSRYARMIPPLS